VTRRKKTKKIRGASSKDLFEQCLRELESLNRRYASLFRFVYDPNTYAPHSFKDEVIEVPIEQDMKAGQTLMVRVPMKFTI
jgi:hypothetical protein